MKQTILRSVLLAAFWCALSVPASAGDLKLSIDAGRVTLIADNVPLRQILQEWSRVGQAKIVNADKLSGPEVTLQLVNMPEKDALDILLRSASGYIAAPRAVALAGASMYDRVTILASSRPPTTTMSSVAPPPTFQRPPQTIDEDEPINIAVPNQPQTSPVVSQYPGMPPALPQGAQGPGVQSQPGAPMTLPRPGALPAPQPNGAPNPYQPAVVRPGGGGPGGQEPI
jgi:hypothetical protein